MAVKLTDNEIDQFTTNSLTQDNKILEKRVRNDEPVKPKLENKQIKTNDLANNLKQNLTKIQSMIEYSVPKNKRYVKQLAKEKNKVLKLE